MYILTLIASISGILSFVLSFIEKLKDWRKYFIYYAIFSIGVAGGIFMTMSNDAIQNFSQEQVIYLIAFVMIMALLILFVYRYLNNVNEVWWVAVLTMVGVGYFAVRLLNSVENSQSFIKSNDYITLSRHYHEIGDYSRAADFLEKYRNIESINLPDNTLKTLDKQVTELREKSFSDIH
ncbi:hypothetical protein ACNR9Q_14380 [Maribacter sp. X9]|uniref:hypothetical protein n=1 Tax=Maribacter sp. X9 TaxID=3402159 RepID=UPI003AF38AE7